MNVLETLYENQVTIKGIPHGPGKAAPDMLVDISENTNLTEQEAIESLRYLNDCDLIEMDEEMSENQDPELHAFGGLTNDGLQLAHEIKTERQQRWTNVILSGGIILVSLLIFFAQVL